MASNNTEEGSGTVKEDLAAGSRPNSATEGGKAECVQTKRERKREEKGLEHVLKSLQGLDSTEDKLTALCKKYSELIDEHKTLQAQHKQTQRSFTVLSREKEQLQAEHGKSVLAKSKLESLCRELQRHNKLVKDESVARQREDDEKRKEVTTKFQTTINDIQSQMNDHYEKNTALREENLELANKLKCLIEQYELREQHIDKLLKSKDLEGQLYEAKLQQASVQLSEVAERHMQEKQLMLQESMEYQKKILLMEEQEKALKAQVEMYSEKYDDFQSTLTQSNKMFTSFKTEMDKMSKKIQRLEKDSSTWKQKWEAGQRSLIDMTEQKLRSDKEVTVLQNKLSKLESLCRALQEERKHYTSSSVSSNTVSKEQEVLLSNVTNKEEALPSKKEQEPLPSDKDSLPIDNEQESLPSNKEQELLPSNEEQDSLSSNSVNNAAADSNTQSSNISENAASASCNVCENGATGISSEDQDSSKDAGSASDNNTDPPDDSVKEPADKDEVPNEEKAETGDTPYIEETASKAAENGENNV